MLSLGFPPLSRTTLPRIAQPHLEDLASRVHESASLAILTPSGEEIQYTAVATWGRIMSVNIAVAPASRPAGQPWAKSCWPPRKRRCPTP